MVYRLPYINDSDKDENIVQKKLLDELNKIIYPDSIYESIKIQKDTSNQRWEIYLTEVGGRRIPLSKCGSGLKTIILVLINLLILSKKKFECDRYIFLFEELENNLHPAIQRRLFDFLYNAISGTENRLVLTSHSAIAINSVYGKEGNGIYHVVKKSNSSELLQVKGYKEQIEILNDLDVRASDILQANCVIWVEGPSDRIYVKRWLELISDGQCLEGVDYQIICYGGKLLSHFSVSEYNTDDLISVLNINKHSIVMMDSDKKAAEVPIGETKLRIKQESQDSGNYVWITEGREIENYIPVAAINKAFNIQNSQVGQYDSFKEYIEPIKHNFSEEKVKFAKEITPFITKENYDVLGLKDKMQNMYIKIREWNAQG